MSTARVIWKEKDKKKGRRYYIPTCFFGCVKYIHNKRTQELNNIFFLCMAMERHLLSRNKKNKNCIFSIRKTKQTKEIETADARVHVQFQVKQTVISDASSRK